MAAFSSKSRRVLHFTVAAATLLAWACNEDSGGDSPGGTSGGAEDDGGPTNPTDPTSETDASETNEGGVSMDDVLRSLADNAFAPTHAEFLASAQAFEDAAGTYANAIADGGDPAEALEVLLPAYQETIAAWQIAEVMQLGPAAGSSGVAGEFLRDEIYSWPSVNSCRIDQELVIGEYEAGDFTSTRLVNVYGFDAIEYLLFNSSPDNTCPPQVEINSSGEWAALGETELAVRRATYAAAIASSITSVASDLADTWAEGGTWNGYLRDPSSGPLETTQVAMDEVLRAMFYIDKSLKDAKVARPAGIKDCTSDICLDTLESPYAAMSKEHAIANLRGFQRLFFAGADAESGVGFDDLLTSLGEGGLADEMVADAATAIEGLEAVEGTFFDALVADGAALDDAHENIVALTDDLKGDFPTVLMLNIPSEAAGDAD